MKNAAKKSPKTARPSRTRTKGSAHRAWGHLGTVGLPLSIQTGTGPATKAAVGVVQELIDAIFSAPALVKEIRREDQRRARAEVERKAREEAERQQHIRQRAEERVEEEADREIEEAAATSLPAVQHGPHGQWVNVAPTETQIDWFGPDRSERVARFVDGLREVELHSNGWFCYQSLDDAGEERRLYGCDLALEARRMTEIAALAAEHFGARWMQAYPEDLEDREKALERALVKVREQMAAAKGGGDS